MYIKDFAEHAIRKANESGVIKITDKPSQWDYIEDLLYKWACILTLVFLFI